MKENQSERQSFYRSPQSVLLWLGRKLNGPYIENRYSNQLFASQKISVETQSITDALINDSYPGFFRIVPLSAPLLGMSARLAGSYSNEAMKAFKKSFQIKSFCIASGDWSQLTQPLKEHPTWDYVALALKYAETGDESNVEAAWQKGLEQERSRYVREDLKIRTEDWTQEDAREYLMRLIGLAEIISKRQRIPTPEALQKSSGREDDSIGVAIDAQGQFLHFRKGHHRMMLAKQLRIPTIDVKLHVVHASYAQKIAEFNQREFQNLV